VVGTELDFKPCQQKDLKMTKKNTKKPDTQYDTTFPQKWQGMKYT